MEDLADTALEAAAEQHLDLDGIAPPEATDGEASLANLQSLIEQVLEIRSIYDAARQSVEESEAGLHQRAADLDARDEELSASEAGLIESEQSITRDRADLEMRRVQLDEQTAALHERELAVEARESEGLAELMARAQAEVLGPVLKMRRELLESEATQVKELLNELAEKRRELERRERQLETREGALVAAEKLLNEERDLWQQDLEVAVSDETSRLKSAVERERNRSRRLERDLEAFEDDRSAVVELTRLANGSGPASVLETVERLRLDLEEARRELATRPEAEIRMHLDTVEAERDRLRALTADLQDEVERQRGEVDAARLAVIERDRLNRTVDVLNAQVAAFSTEVDRLKREYENLTATGRAEVPFPECSRMDQNDALQLRPSQLREKEPQLAEIVHYLQWALRYHRRPGLSFRLDDLRLFIGGLAMSRLHILEGVSGTGKTSLPIAVAEALGGGHAKIEVQAGWRDSQDLIGYYNEFEGRFREHEFTRALYRAMTPRHSDGIFFVVLDEMNLSRPEQYFADYLSKLEDLEGADQAGRGMVTLVPRSFAGDIPMHLVQREEGGVALPLHDNVWFIGTANHDETTASFAPKTQSRAHVMELPRTPPSDGQLNVDPFAKAPFAGMLGHAALRQAFEHARGEHQSEADQANSFFAATMTALEDLDDDLTWGPRLSRQVDRFVPVVVDAGGSLELALDHLLYSKLVRRMRDRFTIDDQARRELREQLERHWPSGQKGFESSKSAAELNRQMSRPG